MSKIKFYRGDTATINLALASTDLTGAAVFFTAKSGIDNDAADATAVVTKKVTTHTNPTAGETTITLSSSDTDGITPDTYDYDIQVVLASGVVSTVQVGKLEVKGDVTRRTA